MRRMLTLRDADLSLLRLDAVKDLFPVHRDIRGCFNPDPNLVTFDTQDGYPDFVTNYEDFADPTGENQH